MANRPAHTASSERSDQSTNSARKGFLLKIPLYIRAIPAYPGLFRKENRPTNAGIPAAPHRAVSLRQRLASAQIDRVGDQPKPKSEYAAFGGILLAAHSLFEKTLGLRLNDRGFRRSSEKSPLFPRYSAPFRPKKRTNHRPSAIRPQVSPSRPRLAGTQVPCIGDQPKSEPQGAAFGGILLAVPSLPWKPTCPTSRTRAASTKFHRDLPLFPGYSGLLRYQLVSFRDCPWGDARGI